MDGRRRGVNSMAPITCAEDLPVADTGRAPPAVRVHVVDLQPLADGAPAGHPGMVLAPVAHPGEDGEAVGSDAGGHARPRG